MLAARFKFCLWSGLNCERTERERGRQEARQKGNEKKRETSHAKNLVWVHFSVSRGNVSSWICLLCFYNLVNIGTFIGVPVGTNWKTNLLIRRTKIILRFIDIIGFSVTNTQWKHMHCFAKLSHLDPHLLSSVITWCSVTSVFQKQRADKRLNICRDKLASVQPFILQVSVWVENLIGGRCYSMFQYYWRFPAAVRSTQHVNWVTAKKEPVFFL